MTTAKIKRALAGALLSGGVAAAAVGLGAGAAQAYTYPIGVCNGMACSYEWCPGMPLPTAFGTPNWDMGVCHHFMIGTMNDNSPAWVSNGGVNRQVAAMLIEGDPGPCPGCVS
ncbi:hypothetical protein MKUB_50630 [Mycobacterium kubicae]|uniref:Secreted protein n=1 Tax=Mycobacterium kubicae TaxID=120959 RepID=A0AAX1JKI6_9MYCO|nr:hypothetical protein [Mycobacterium kubicae]MCV7094612.1 hypothetical protein [Mycobacterium kubicae]OBF17626.1 hypothetical protein A5725_22275 [Mycobacterium kubicae]ORV97586.1 hypothetical protein AWC13_15195 [Mycobacterium kubicae]QNI12960.1 hypothetical protein GAN18_18855 [Mycobacterium kubicae]QPI41032.1 hypothetical protein I2456_18550 [Mycobacterium kubicae]